MADEGVHGDPSVAPGPEVRTWDVLVSLGFEPDVSMPSGEAVVLKRDFGSFVLKATDAINTRLQPVVTLWRVYRTSDTMAEVEHDLPRMLESRELGVALLTWCLDEAADGEFRAATPTPWLAEGRAWRHLLPWEQERPEREREQAERAACPRCTVERRWARPAANDLIEQAARVAADSMALVRFDGEVLTVRCGERLVAVPAIGLRWAKSYLVPAGALRSLPKRLKDERVEVAIFKGALLVGRCRCEGVVEATSEGAG
jgi:hypothetical protein